MIQILDLLCSCVYVSEEHYRCTESFVFVLFFTINSFLYTCKNPIYAGKCRISILIEQKDLKTQMCSAAIYSFQTNEAAIDVFIMLLYCWDHFVCYVIMLSGFMKLEWLQQMNSVTHTSVCFLDQWMSFPKKSSVRNQICSVKKREGNRMTPEQSFLRVLDYSDM